MENVKEIERVNFVKALRLFEQLMRAEIVAKRRNEYELVKTIREQRKNYKRYM